MDRARADNREAVDIYRPSHVREASVFDYVRVVVRHWRLVLLVCIPVVAAVVIWSLVMTETYRATTSIVPPVESLQGGSMGLAQGLLGGAGGGFLRSALNVTSVADLYVGILESRDVADTLLDRFDLKAVYRFPQQKWRAEQQLRDSTTIKLTKEGIVEVSVVDTDPVRAAAIANAYVEELDLRNKRLSSGQASSKKIFLENRLKEIEEKFSRIESIPSHEAHVQEVLYELLIRECELAKIEEAKSMPTIQVLDEATPPEHKHKPNRRQMVMRAAVGSFALAVLLAFFLEYRDRVKYETAASRVWRSGESREALDVAAGESLARAEEAMVSSPH